MMELGSIILPTDEIHIWSVSLDQLSSRFPILSELLSVDERMRAERLHLEKQRKHFVICRGVLRIILGHYLGIDPIKLRFCYRKYGKPALTNACNGMPVHFNLSRSEGIALYAFTRSHEIGVDIEWVRDLWEKDAIAGQFFSATEIHILYALPEDKKKNAFFKLWTRKEAYIKALGDGLHRPLNSFAVSLAPTQSVSLLETSRGSQQAAQWAIGELHPASGFVAAFAVEESPRWQLRGFQWSDCLL